MGVWVRSQSSNWLVFASEFYIKTNDTKFYQDKSK